MDCLHESEKLVDWVRDGNEPEEYFVDEAELDESLGAIMGERE